MWVYVRGSERYDIFYCIAHTQVRSYSRRRCDQKDEEEDFPRPDCPRPRNRKETASARLEMHNTLIPRMGSIFDFLCAVWAIVNLGIGGIAEVCCVLVRALSQVRFK